MPEEPRHYRNLGPLETIRSFDETKIDGIWCPVPPAHVGSHAERLGAVRRRVVDAEPATEGVVKAATPPPLDPKGSAGALKPQLQLIPPALNFHLAGALALGAKKYGPWNWRAAKVESMTYVGAIRRHLDAYLDGEEIDPESGVHHLGHVAACCAIVLDASKHGSLVDNRPRTPKTVSREPAPTSDHDRLCQVGPGFRLLQVGESIQAGDCAIQRGEWRPVPASWVGDGVITESSTPIRRSTA